MAEAVGFEPTCQAGDYFISSEARYDHFEYASIVNNITKVSNNVDFL